MTKYEKILATKQANKEKRESQTLVIDKNWKIVRSDPLNWEIRYKGREFGFYPTIPNALKALPDKMLNEEAKGSLNQVIGIYRGIQERIEEAFSDR